MSDFDTEEAIVEMIKTFANGAESKIFENDFSPQIAFYASDHPEAPRIILFPRMVDESSRHPISWAMHVLAASLEDLSGIAFVHDGYRASQMTKSDGSPWEPGDMQTAFLGNTVDKALVSEALYYTVVTQDAVHMAGLPYERTDQTIEFTWNDLTFTSTDHDKVEAAGFYPDLMRHAFGTPKIRERMAEFGTGPEDFDLSEEDARLHVIALAVKMVIVNTQMPCVVPCQSERESEIMHHSFTSGPFSENIATMNQDDVDEIVTLEEAFEAPSFGEEED